jgi:hypothetical protein
VNKNLASWFHTPTVQPSDKVEGCTVKDDVLWLGRRAAFEASDESLLHEMAHFIEIDDERCVTFGWGLSVTQVFILGQFYNEPTTFQACARELRVSAIQKVLSEHFGIAFSDQYWGKLVYDFVPGSLFAYQEYEDVVPLSKDDRPYKERERALIDRFARDIREQAKKLKIEQLRAEWDRKCAVADALLQPR